jgi:hypothetical protein
MDVILKAGAGMESGQIHGARGDKEVAVNKIHDTVSQVGGKVWTVIKRAVLLQPACNINAGEPFLQRKFNERVRFIVTEQNVIAWLKLLDEVVLQRYGLPFVVHEDSLEVLGHVQHSLPLIISGTRVLEIAPNPVAQRLCFANINGPTRIVFEYIYPWLGGQGFGFFEERRIH